MTAEIAYRVTIEKRPLCTLYVRWESHFSVQKGWSQLHLVKVHQDTQNYENAIIYNDCYGWKTYRLLYLKTSLSLRESIDVYN